MTAARRRWAAELLQVWFHSLEPESWWGGSDAVDAMLRRRFARDLDALGSRPAAEFLTDAPTARAAILLFDQIPRNIYRGTVRAYGWDTLARKLSRGTITREWDRGLAPSERQFIYLPLMHSEAIADQLLSLRCFAARGMHGAFAFARSHHKMIARFGSFPHRNAVLVVDR